MSPYSTSIEIEVKETATHTVTRFDPQQNMDDEYEITVSGLVNFDVIDDEGVFSLGDSYVEGFKALSYPIKLTPEEVEAAKMTLVNKAFSEWLKRNSKPYNPFKHP
jgi:hypothetical protein